MNRTNRQRTALATALTLPLIAAASLAIGAILLRATMLLQAEARSSYGTEALSVLVLLALAVLGIALCAYLALVHGLAAVVMLRGADATGSRALLGALRVLAPRLAARALTTLAVTTATAGLLAGPAQAQGAPSGPPSTAASAAALAPTGSPAPLMRLPEVPEKGHEPTGSSHSAQLPAEPGDPSPETPAEQPSAPPSAEPTGTQSSGTGPAESGDGELPGLGWGDQDAPAAPDDDTTEGPGDSRDQPGTRTVVVQEGDSLWSISDDLLGVGSDDPAAIAARWPALFAANAEIIGENPDHLEPGQVLTVPDSLHPSQEK